MATDTTLNGLLKSPNQLRNEAQAQIMKDSFARNQQMLMGSRGGTTALPGIIASYGAQAAQRGAQAGAGLLRGVTGGIGSAVGGDMGQRISNLGIPADERTAIAQQTALQNTSYTDVDSMKRALARLQKMGAPLQAILLLSNKIAEQEATAITNKLKTEGLKVDQGTLKIKKQQLELEQAQLDVDKKLGAALGQYNLSTEQGVSDAVNALFKIGDKEAIALAIRLKTAFKGQDPSAAEKTINYFLKNFSDPNLSDAENLARAYDKAKDYQSTRNPTTILKQINGRYDKATASRTLILRSNTALKQIYDAEQRGDELYVGFAGTGRLGFQKFISLVLGIDDQDQAATETEKLIANVSGLSAAKLATGDYGSGTGISDKDMEQAKIQAGASQNLNLASMKLILRANRAIDIVNLRNYETYLTEGVQPSLFASAQVNPSFYQVKVPEPWKSPEEKKEQTWESVAPTEGDFPMKDKNGIEVRRVNGRLEYKNGTPFKRKK